MKIFEGKVIATKMNRTVVVEVFRMTPHPLYRKLVKLSKKFKVDNFGFENVTVGSIVKIAETKPISKYKHFKIAEIVTLRKDENVISAETEIIKVSKKTEKETSKVDVQSENKNLTIKKEKKTKKETKK